MNYIRQWKELDRTEQVEDVVELRYNIMLQAMQEREQREKNRVVDTPGMCGLLMLAIILAGVAALVLA